MKVAILWLINEKGEILMARRAAHLSTDAGVWGPSVSGGVDDDESFQEAVLREAHEELGLTGNDISPIFLHEETYAEHSDGNIRQFGLFYAMLSRDTFKRLRLEPDEVAEVKWFTRKELEQLATTGSKSLIISSATVLWRGILMHLQPITV